MINWKIGQKLVCVAESWNNCVGEPSEVAPKHNEVVTYDGPATEPFHFPGQVYIAEYSFGFTAWCQSGFRPLTDEEYMEHLRLEAEREIAEGVLIAESEQTPAPCL